MSRALGFTLLGAGAGLAFLGVRALRQERIPGGRASGMRPEDFDPEQLAAGIEVELEHTTSRRVAREIAMDHLVEDPRYYEKLARVGL